MPVLSASSLSLTSSQPMIVAGLMATSARPFWYVSLFQDVIVWANESGGMTLASHIRLMTSMADLLAGFLMSGTPFSSASRAVRPGDVQEVVHMIALVAEAEGDGVGPRRLLRLR